MHGRVELVWVSNCELERMNEMNNELNWIEVLSRKRSRTAAFPLETLFCLKSTSLEKREGAVINAHINVW